MQTRKRNNEAGYALLLTLMISALVLPLGAFALMQARIDLLTAQHGRRATELFYTAESGLEHALADLRLEPFFDRFEDDTEAEWAREENPSFPFLKPSANPLPSDSLQYEITVEFVDSEQVRIVSKASGRMQASQTVSSSIMRSSKPFTPGAIFF